MQWLGLGLFVRKIAPVISQRRLALQLDVQVAGPEQLAHAT